MEEEKKIEEPVVEEVAVEAPVEEAAVEESNVDVVDLANDFVEVVGDCEEVINEVAPAPVEEIAEEAVVEGGE